MTGHGGDDANIVTPVDIPAELPGHDVEVEVNIRVGDRAYRMFLDPDGISIPGTTQYGPGRDAADAIAEAMHRAVWYADGSMRRYLRAAVESDR